MVKKMINKDNEIIAPDNSTSSNKKMKEILLKKYGELEDFL